MRTTTVLVATVSLAAAIAGVAVAIPQKARDVRFRGAADAKVTIVEYVDYECGYCKKAERTMNALLERYPNQLRLELVHSPLPFHANAAVASAAVIAAGEQGKNWEMHDLLMASKKLDRAVIDQHAAALGLDLGKFGAAIERASAQVALDVERGKAQGVKGTPAFFINGRHIVGAQPIENFARVIDEELGLTAKTADAPDEEPIECVQKHDDGC